MPLAVTIREAAQDNGERCAFFDTAFWWDPAALMKDPRFRVLDRACYYGVASFMTKEMKELQNRFRPAAEHLQKRESDRLDLNLDEDGDRWWVVTVYEWESGLD
jgi:hypothetical protein